MRDVLKARICGYYDKGNHNAPQTTIQGILMFFDGTISPLLKKYHIFFQAALCQAIHAYEWEE